LLRPVRHEAGERERESNVQGGAVHRGGVGGRRGQTQRLRGKAVLPQPNHDLMARPRLIVRFGAVAVEEHINGYIAIEVAGDQRVRVRDGDRIVADGIGPVHINIQILDVGDEDGQGGGYELRVGEGMNRLVLRALRVLPGCGKVEGIELVLWSTGICGQLDGCQHGMSITAASEADNSRKCRYVMGSDGRGSEAQR
jgi:hypothetical protein